MKVKTAPSNTNGAATGGKVVKVRQEGTELDLDLEGGTTRQDQTAEATSSSCSGTRRARWSMRTEHGGVAGFRLRHLAVESLLCLCSAPPWPRCA